MYGDREWAQQWLARLETLRTPSAEVLELRAAGVSELRIQNLYPPLDVREYVVKITQLLADLDTLRRVSDTLAISEASKLLDLLPAAEKLTNEARIGSAANDLLDVVLALPTEGRPTAFALRPESHLADMSFALNLCEELFRLLTVLGYIASGDLDFQKATAQIEMRVHHHRIRHLVRRLAG